jgi:hypothetical protein
MGMFDTVRIEGGIYHEISGTHQTKGLYKRLYTLVIKEDVMYYQSNTGKLCPLPFSGHFEIRIDQPEGIIPCTYTLFLYDGLLLRVVKSEKYHLPILPEMQVDDNFEIEGQLEWLRVWEEKARKEKPDTVLNRTKDSIRNKIEDLKDAWRLIKR